MFGQLLSRAIVGCGLLSSGILVTAFSGQQQVAYGAYSPGPTGGVITTKPAISWTIWGEGDTKVTSAIITLNGNTLAATYDPESLEVSAEDKTLAPGDYDVHCQVLLNDRFKVTKNWKFTVLADAKESFPAPTLPQRRIIETVNQIRTEHQLPPVQPHPGLLYASQAHSNFMYSNRTVTHYQDRAKKGFLGASGGDRAMTVGFSEFSAEVVSRSNKDLIGAVKQLFEAPYHRLTFLRPGKIYTGAGVTDSFYCINFGGIGSPGDVCSPANNATSVPTTWMGNESPDPLRMTGLSAPVGYPITFSAFRRIRKEIKFVSGKVTGPGGTEIKIHVNHPGNDTELKDSLILIPHRPLANKTTYQVEVAYQIDGESQTQRWGFTTE